MNTLKIKEPCHEKWSEFTPTQQGAFCKTCAIDVIDFSEKSNTEIKTILKLNTKSKLCGRFTKTQLENYNTDYHIWQNQNNATFQSKFIFSLVLAFGLTLFSCSTPTEHQVIKHLTTSIVNENKPAPTLPLTDLDTLTSTIDTPIDTTSNRPCSTPKNEVIEFIMGDVELAPETIYTTGEVILDDIDEEESEMILGKVALPPVDKDTLN